MKKNFLITAVLGFSLLMSGACSKEDVPPPTPGPDDPGYENGEDVTGEEDTQVKVLKISGLQNNANIQETELKKMIDGNAKTFYSAKTVSSQPVTLDFTFEGTSVIDYFIYTPNNKDGSWGDFEVFVKENDNAEFQSVLVKNITNPEWPVAVYLPNGIKARVIRIVVKTGFNDKANCAEMSFFSKVKPSFDFSTLFTDITCSKLKDGVTKETIEACGEPFYKTMATAMLEDKYPYEFRVNEFKSKPHPGIQAEKLLVKGFSLYENVTGIYVKKNDELVVFAGDFPSEESVSIKIIDFDDEKGYANGMTAALRPGFNKIKTTNKGLVYVVYFSNNYETLSPVKIHFATGEVNGYFDATDKNSEHWTVEKFRNLVTDAPCGYFDVLGKYTHIAFSSKDFKTYCADPYELISLYDGFVECADELMGLTRYGLTLQNRVFYHYMVGDGAMYSASNHISITAPLQKAFSFPVKYDELKGKPWGPAHELGHALQIKPGRLVYTGMGEVTNNILSVYVQTHSKFGNPSWLLHEIQNKGNDTYQSDYERAMTFYQALGKPHNFQHIDRKMERTKLVPLWQIYLYFAKVLNHHDWFQDFYEEMRNEQSASEDGDAQMNFVRKFCKVSGMNLLDFFEHSGFFVPCNHAPDEGKVFKLTEGQIKSLKDEINAAYTNKPEVEFWRITDENIELFKTQASVSGGNYTKSGNKFTISGCQNAVAYEVQDNNGKILFVSPHAEFTVNVSVTDNCKVFAYGAKGDSVVLTKN